MASEELRHLRPSDGVSVGKVHAILAFLCVSSVFLVHLVHHHYGLDPLAIPYLNGPLVSIDSWSIVHILSCVCLGYFFPARAGIVMFYAVLWEMLEHAISENGVFGKLTQHPAFWTEAIINSLWDLWFNLLGYRLGERLLARELNRRIRREQKKE